MQTNTKHTMNKSCHCGQCRRGMHSTYGQGVQRMNNRKLRRIGRAAVSAALKTGDIDEFDVSLGPISSPYTD